MHKIFLERLGIEKLNDMQRDATSQVLARDVVLLSPTGSGKTLAFLLPLVSMLRPEGNGIQALIVVPGRELAQQIEKVFRAMATGFKVALTYGGHSVRTEVNRFAEPPAVLIGTPGRLCHHIREGHISLDGVRTLILDEFDKSLEYGFETDMDFICRKLPVARRTVLTSASPPKTIPSFVGLSEPATLNFLSDSAVKPEIRTHLWRVKPEDKWDSLLRLLGARKTIIFVNHREFVNELSNRLFRNNVVHSAYHGGLEQHDREKALVKFRNGTHRLLVTTDLASRGLDIAEVDCVIHYQVPHDRESFIHRNGRTARMGATGQAIMLLTDEEIPKWLDSIELADSPIIAEGFDGPECTTLYFSGGRKNKISRADIMGVLIHKAGLAKQEIGLIDIFDTTSYVAIPLAKAGAVLEKMKGVKVKNKRIRVGIAES